MWWLSLLACSPEPEASPAADEVEVWTSITVDGCNGERIAAQRYRREGATATLLIVPGYTEYTDKYHHLPEHVPDVDLLVYDHYGQGRSTGIRAHNPGMDEQLVCDLDAVRQLVDGTLYVMAHSMGGLVTARWLALGGEADGVVLSSPMIQIDTGDVSYAIATSLAAGAVEQGQAEEPYGEAGVRDDCEDNIVTHDCDRYDLFKDDPLTLIGPTTYGWLHEGFSTGDALRANASSFPAEIALFQAGDEHIVVNDAQTTFCAEVDAANPGGCTLTTYPGQYHELMQELDRQATFDAAMAWFQR